MISKKEVINCFFYQALISIKNEKEVPNFNIVFNSNINVDVLRIDRDTTITLDGVNKNGKDIYSLTQEKSINKDTVLFNTFVSKGEYQIDAQYFDPNLEIYL